MYIALPFYIIFYSLEYAFGKKVILYGYLSFYLIIIMKGVIKLIFNIIFSVIVLIADRKILTTFNVYFKEKKSILLIIGKIIIKFFYDLFLWIIVDKFSPNYTCLAILLEELCNFVADLLVTKIFSELGDHKYIRIVLYVISFIGVILHNQIIVINICGLGEDTKYFLDKIAKSEAEYSISNEPNILKRFETLEMIDFKDEDFETN